MGKFHAWHCTVSLDCICCEGESSQGANCGKVKMKHVGTVCLRVNYKLTHGYSCGSAFGTKLVEGTGSLAWYAVLVNIGCSDRGCKHAVAEGYVS